MSNEGYHEPINELTDETRDMHRAITSLMEELEAVDWYNQRVDACKDPELKSILEHNRDDGIDSLDSVEIAMKIEEELGYLIPAENLTLFTKVNHYVNYIN